MRVMSDELRSMLSRDRTGPFRPTGTLQISGDGAAIREGFTKLQQVLEVVADNLLRKVGLTRFGYEYESVEHSFNEEGEDDYLPLPVECIGSGGALLAVCCGRV